NSSFTNLLLNIVNLLLKRRKIWGFLLFFLILLLCFLSLLGFLCRREFGVSNLRLCTLLRCFSFLSSHIHAATSLGLFHKLCQNFTKLCKSNIQKIRCRLKICFLLSRGSFVHRLNKRLLRRNLYNRLSELTIRLN